MLARVVHFHLAEGGKDRLALLLGNGTALVGDLQDESRRVGANGCAHEYLRPDHTEFEGVVQQLSEHQLYALAIYWRAARFGGRLEPNRSLRRQASDQRRKLQRPGAVGWRSPACDQI